MSTSDFKLALLLPGRYEDGMSKDNCRLTKLFVELEKHSVPAELVLYSSDLIDELEQKLLQFNLVMVWVNPIHEGQDRSRLDDLLRRVANQGVIVSTHPDIILKMGTKDVLYQTKDMDWGTDVQIYKNFEEFRETFPTNLQKGSRVLKQYRGNGGNGVWRVEFIDETFDGKPRVFVLHAKRGSMGEEMLLDQFIDKMKMYFEGSGHLLDQEYLRRLPEGMIRCYFSVNKLVGFGHQYVTALVKPDGDEPLIPPPRYYYSKEKAEFQDIRELMESKLIKAMQDTLDIATESLPLLWDADFLFGEKDKDGHDTFKLCEINVSSVYPYPDQANPDLIEAIKKRMGLEN